MISHSGKNISSGWSYHDGENSFFIDIFVEDYEDKEYVTLHASTCQIDWDGNYIVKRKDILGQQEWQNQMDKDIWSFLNENRN